MSNFEIFITIITVICNVLCIILFFKVWGMTNDIHALRQHFSPEEVKKDIVDDVDNWVETGHTTPKQEKEEIIKVGASVITIVPKYGLDAGSELKVKSKTAKGQFICTLDGKEVGKFTDEEIFTAN